MRMVHKRRNRGLRELNPPERFPLMGLFNRRSGTHWSDEDIALLEGVKTK
jgi:hypothetical protein